MKALQTILTPGISILVIWAACFTVPGNVAAGDAPRSIAPYFMPAKSPSKAPDQDGFLRRWLLLEPSNKPNRTSTVFTVSCPILSSYLFTELL